MRRTKTLIKIGTHLLANPDDQHYGYHLSKAVDVRSPSIYRVLNRLHDAKWLSSGSHEPSAPGKPARRYYVLTDLGRQQLAALLAEPQPR